MKFRILLLSFFCLISNASFAQSGLTWTNVDIGGTNLITSISIASKDTAFARNNNTPASEIRSIDGGYTWSPFPTPGGFWVKFLDPSIGYTFGDNGDTSWTLATTDGGAHWGSEVNDSAGGLGVAPVILNKDTALLACGSAGIIMRTTDGGSSWHKMNAPFIAGIYSIAFFDPMHGVAVGEHLTTGGCLSLVSSDGGMNWKQVSNPAFQDLIGVTCCGLDTAICIGDAIERSTDGGNTWTDVTPALGFIANWSAISSSHNNVVAVGFGGVIIYSSDAGLTWKGEASGTTQDLWSMQMFGDTEAICTGQSGTILRGTGVASSVSQAASSSESVAGVYPNPAENMVTFNLDPSSGSQFLCSIYTETGALLEKVPITTSTTAIHSTGTLDISSLPDATYFYRLTGEHFSHTGAFVVSHK